MIRAMRWTFPDTPHERDAVPYEQRSTHFASSRPISSNRARASERNTRRVTTKGYVQNIEEIATSNTDFRQVLFTATNCQLVVMALDVHADIGEEVHTVDQFFRVEQGNGAVVLDGVQTEITAGFAILIPAGTTHNIINTGDLPMKLYTLYAPPNHRDGVVHRTRADADADDEHFDGKTTE